jgi:regulation of enolase protein 1 (concanavalin A-like superfamily)
MPTYHHLNFPPNTPLPDPTSSGSVTITTPSGTDIWRKPPSLNSFSAPIIYRSLAISAFKSARVTLTTSLKTLYDQGGLLLLFPSTSSSPSTSSWLKTGLEYYASKPMMSVVATSASSYSDWSLLPLPSPSTSTSTSASTTVEVEREQEKDGSYGSVLRVSLVGAGGSKMPVREVTWAFHGLDESEEMWVGMMAAKPTKGEGDEELSVRFEGFEIVTRN